MYLLAREWGIQPSEFWAMTVSEWLLEYEQRRPKMKGDYAGSLTQGVVDELREMLRADDGATGNQDQGDSRDGAGEVRR